MGDRNLKLLLPPSLGETRAGARADLLAGELTQRLDVPVSVRVGRSYAEVAMEALAEHVDLVWAPPRLHGRLVPRARAVLTCVRVDGPAEYRSALLARRGEVRSMSDLVGLRAAWVDRESTGGYRLVAEMLRHEGAPPSKLFSSEHFFGSYHEAIMAVVRGDADVCAVYTQTPDEAGVAVSLEELVGSFSGRLEAAAYTAPTPADAFILTRRADEALATRVVELLLSRHCPQMLLEACNAVRFERR